MRPRTSISRRSCAILNNVFASKVTATVWPGLTSRLMTTPSIGATNLGALTVKRGLIEYGLFLLDHCFRIRQIGVGHRDIRLRDVDGYA